VKELNTYEFRISMSRKGNLYDNTNAESPMKTLKTEDVSLWEYRTIANVLERIPLFIEDVYIRKRFHSSLGSMPPCEHEDNPKPLSGLFNRTALMCANHGDQPVRVKSFYTNQKECFNNQLHLSNLPKTPGSQTWGFWCTKRSTPATDLRKPKKSCP